MDDETLRANVLRAAVAAGKAGIDRPMGRARQAAASLSRRGLVAYLRTPLPFDGRGGAKLFGVRIVATEKGRLAHVPKPAAPVTEEESMPNVRDHGSVNLRAAKRALAKGEFDTYGKGCVGLSFRGDHFGSRAQHVLTYERGRDGTVTMRLECAVGGDEYQRYDYSWATTADIDSLDRARLRHARADIVAMFSPDGDASWSVTSAFIDSVFATLAAFLETGAARAA